MIVFAITVTLSAIALLLLGRGWGQLRAKTVPVLLVLRSDGKVQPIAADDERLGDWRQ